MPLGYFFMSNWKKIVLVVLVLIAVAPFVLLHLFVLCARVFEPKLQGATVTTIPTTNGLSMRVYRRDHPRAETTLVFIHGSPATARAFHAQFAEGFSDANLLAYDRPGFGGSPANADSLNLRAQVVALGSLLREAQPTNCVLVGHSYGSAVALQAALDYPQFVRGIVLVGGSIDPAQEKSMRIQQVAMWPIVHSLLPSALDNCNSELLALKTDLRALRGRLSQLNVPVVMVHGARDRLVPLANVDFLERELDSLGKANLFVKIVLPNDNHFIPWKRPEAVRAAFDRLRDSISSRNEKVVRVKS